MSYIYDLKPEHYGTLLAVKELDIADKSTDTVAGTGKIPAGDQNRTILIGLGGTGLKTINHVKREISMKLAPGWDKYIAFLAIDSDNNEFRNMTHLKPEEFVRTTKDGIVETVDNGEGDYPSAWLPFVDPAAVAEMTDVGGNGSGRKRLLGKMKFHYKRNEDTGVDQEIVDKLSRRKTTLKNFSGAVAGHYDVYVIGSVSGGTCSGGFLEMPALVRKALGDTSEVQVHAILYLPDTLTSVFASNKEELMANGYASLKELNYYQGLSMREGYEESWYYNDPADFELKLDNKNDFFKMPYLIGTRAGGNADSERKARETIAEFFVSILGNMVSGGKDGFMVDSFVNNAMQHVNDKFAAPGNATIEAPGSSHEFPKRFATIGFARAAAPAQIVKAHTIAYACKLAGLEPVGDDERAERKANGDPFLPFYGENQYFSVAEVNQRTEELLASLNAFMNRYQAATFEYKKQINTELTWEDIRSGDADNGTQMQLVNNFIAEQAKSSVTKELAEQMDKEFQTYRAAVKQFVMTEGPMAFVNLFEGNAVGDSDGKSNVVGVRKVLLRHKDGQRPQTGEPIVWGKAVDFQKKRQDAKAAIDGKASGWLVNQVAKFIDMDRGTQMNNWVTAFDDEVNAKINEKRREDMLGAQGILNKNFIEPAIVLTEQIKAFGKLLETLAAGYRAHGAKLDDYEKFRSSTGGKADVNIAAVNTTAHGWLRQQAEANTAAVNGQQVRDALITSFFNDPSAWLTVDDLNIKKTDRGDVSLVDDSMPISARYEFDKCMRTTITNLDMEITVEQLFVNVNNLNLPFDTYAEQIIEELATESKPLFNFNGKPSEGDYHRYIMYPQSLASNNPEVEEAIKQAARNRFPGIGFYGTSYADAIMMYQFVAPFEIYHLKELPEWERQYNVKIGSANNGLHGRSPDLKSHMDDEGNIHYSENTPWKKYPAITYSKDHKERNAVTGKISAEGEVRLEMDKVIAEAKRKGILFAQQNTDGQYYICRIHLDRSTEWQFDEDLLMPNSKGLYPEGKALLEYVVRQSRKKLDGVTRVVRLAYAGLLSTTHKDEKKAWEYAYRTLYAHRKMFCEIRDTLELTKGWYEIVEQMNEEAKRELDPAKMYRLMQARVLYQAEGGMWIYEDESGNEVPVVNMNPAVLKKLKVKSPRDAAVVDTGLVLYYIYRKLMDKLTVEELNSALDRAQSIMEEYRDEELLDAAVDQAETMLNAEIEILTGMGIDLEEYDRLTSKVYKAMENNKIKNKEQVDEICKFYNKIQLWDSLG